MIYIVENIVPIAAATLLGLVIGFVWLRAARLPSPGVPALVAIALAEFWLAAILAGALILAPPQADMWTMSLGSAFIIWVGFVLPAITVTFLAGGIAKRMIVSASAHWLVVMVAQAAIMRAIGLVAPEVQ
ncbi:MAG: hypothetical protein ACTS1Z_00710 [Parasphingopyxis sp.]|uniref:hypothetical protein n=1 Tax=Parasphingopyxis sp. TaxID=1920299 RepID=UPI003FA14F73